MTHQLLFTRVPESSIAEVWPDVRETVARALRGTGDTEADVMQACQLGEAHLFLIDSGLFVLSEFRDADEDRRRKILIWLASCSGSHNIGTYYPLIERLARTVGAVAVRARSTRKGMRRALRDWRSRPMPGCTEYEREVPDVVLA